MDNLKDEIGNELLLAVAVLHNSSKVQKGKKEKKFNHPVMLLQAPPL